MYSDWLHDVLINRVSYNFFFRFTESQTEACTRRSGRIISGKTKIESLQRVLCLYSGWFIRRISWSNLYSIRASSKEFKWILDFKMFALWWGKKYVEFFLSNVIIFLVLFNWNLLSKVSPNIQTIQFEFQFARKAVMWCCGNNTNYTISPVVKTVRNLDTISL